MELVTESGAVCVRTPQKTTSSRSKNSSHVVPELRLPFLEILGINTGYFYKILEVKLLQPKNQ
jgi:hypothetical protein